MRQAQDLRGDTYGSLVVLYKAKKQDSRKNKWTCLCDCGNIKDISSDSLKRQAVKSCGCYRHDQSLDETGNKYGRLTVLSKSRVDKQRFVVWKCLCDCGEFSYVRGSSLRNKHTQSCGCLMDDTQRNMRGENSPLWKGGITNPNKLLRTSKAYKDWRTKVFDRDDYTCQKCKTRGSGLEAHHIHDFSTFEEDRTDVNNGVTLCKKHHKEFHSIFGNQYPNNAYQLLGYLAIS